MRHEHRQDEASAASEPEGHSSSVWNSRVQWGAVLAGTFAGLAATIIMGTLGAALGMTAGAASMTHTDSVNSDMAEKAAVGFGLGAGIWMLLTALVTGILGGSALNATARRD